MMMFLLPVHPGVVALIIRRLGHCILIILVLRRVIRIVVMSFHNVKALWSWELVLLHIGRGHLLVLLVVFIHKHWVLLPVAPRVHRVRFEVHCKSY